MKIIGAGLSGLICGALNAQATIYERNPSSFTSHRAVLRFRTDKIARALGLNFRPVTVRKAIWTQGEESPPTPRLANFYSLKVRGILAESSIWNMSASERFIAPEDLHAVLADICGARVEWEHEIERGFLRDWHLNGDQIISTVPLPILCRTLEIAPGFPLAYSPITVSRFRVPGCDLFQTIYFPDLLSATYRATLTGSLLTVEAMGPIPAWELKDVTDAFGLAGIVLDPVDLNHEQRYGKIAPAPSGERKALLHSLTQQHGIYSLGRFATWKNILLDDVYEDITVIRRMMQQSHYDVQLERMKS